MSLLGFYGCVIREHTLRSLLHMIGCCFGQLGVYCKPEGARLARRTNFFDSITSSKLPSLSRSLLRKIPARVSFEDVCVPTWQDESIIPA